ncbi:MAG: cytochrome P460 family protein [Bauldia sp.]
MNRTRNHVARTAIAGAAAVVATCVAIAGPEKVGTLPADFRTAFTLIATRDMHLGGNAIADVYVNSVALQSGKGDKPLAPGSVIAMEVFGAKLDANNQPIFDAKGRLAKDQPRAVNVMEKRAGWGAEYSDKLRNGEWEYASFNLQGVKSTNPTTGCFECHGSLRDLPMDFIYTRSELSEAAEKPAKTN